MLLRFAAVAVLLASAAAGVQTWRLHSLRTDYAQEKAAQAESDRLKSRALLASVERIDRDTTTRLRVSAAAAATARADLERLRSAAASIGADDPGATGCADDGRLGRVTSLLAEGAGLVEEGGRRVEQLAIEKLGLQRDAAGIRQVLVTP